MSWVVSEKNPLVSTPKQISIGLIQNYYSNIDMVVSKWQLTCMIASFGNSTLKQRPAINYAHIIWQPSSPEGGGCVHPCYFPPRATSHTLKKIERKKAQPHKEKEI